MRQKYSSVVVTGSIAYDEIMDFPGKFVDHFHPEKLHQINISFAVSNLEKQLGGTATNIAYNIKLILKNCPVKILSAIGKDGREFIKFYKKNKIDIDGLIIDKKLFTATGKVISDMKDNQIWGYYYGASRLANKIDLSKYVDNNSLVIISANHADGFLHFQKQAISLRLPYLYDPGMSLTWIKNRQLKYGVQNCQWLVGNDYEIAQIRKRLNVSINQLIDTGIAVITTLGEKGVRYDSKSYKLHVTSYKVRNVVDPTGAGDAWRAGFIAGIVEGRPIVDCLKLGNALASFAIEKYGTVNHHPSKIEIEKRLKKIRQREVYEIRY